MAYTPFHKALATAGLLMFSASAAIAADKPALLSGASADMLANTCAGCHGTDGASNGPATPTIAGLSKDYFVEIMQGFKSGEVPSTIMTRIAKGYSDDEFKAMADYFGNKPFVKAKQKYDPKLAKKGAKLHDKYCEKCHAEGGQSAEDDAGVLAGQWTPYVSWSLADFKAGHREAPKKMKKKMKKLLSKKGDAGIEALIHFYASQQ
ncbi:MAG TPA: cytochrome c4 [Chromatiales bacterium]|nr:cytochrome c4 [Chromatiales bacterium]